MALGFKCCMTTRRTRLTRFLQFRLRTLLVLVTALSVLAAYVGWQVRRAERQRRAVEAILAAGGFVEYDFEASAEHDLWRGTWLRRWLGNDLLHDVTAVEFDAARMMIDSRRYDPPSEEQLAAAIARLTDLPALERLRLGMMLPVSDDDMRRLATLTRLKQLTLYAPLVTDEGLAHLAALTGLERLHVDYTSATQDGIDRLRAALPGCDIQW